MKKLRVGFIGAGSISAMHYPGYKDNPKAEVCAICDADEAQLQQRATEWGIERAYTDYHELLAQPDLDAVEVLTPHHLHAEHGVATLEAGKHLSLQKPVAVSVAECDALIDSAERSGKLYRVLENFRYYPPMVKAKELLDSGAIGEPLSIRIKCVMGTGGEGWEIPVRRWSWRFDPDRGGGGRVIFDYGYHLWSIAMWYFGQVEKVCSYITHRPIYDRWVIDSPAVAIWKYRDGDKYGSYEAVTSEEMLVGGGRVPEDEWVELTGSKGFIFINRCSAQLLDRPPLEMYVDGVTTKFSDVDADHASSFIAGVHDFVDAIGEGRQPGLSGQEAKDVFRFCRAVEVSAREGREIRPDEIV